MLARLIAGAQFSVEGDWLSAAVIARETGQFVGDVSLQWVSDRHKTGEIGFIFDRAHQGRGYATEAARAFLAFAFEGMGFHRVIGRLEARNTASARVLEKLGMRREAHLVENEWVKGEWQSELVYAMLEHEWR
jgi:RimJ/RimL family protein N-acetyltransferase